MQRMSKMKNMRTALLFLLVAMISLSVSAQNVTVKGTVKDKTGETVIGASVVQKGNTGNGTITDIDGNFSVSGKKGSTLVFSYIGMLTQEVVYKGTALRVVMKDDSKALEEVVVIGYQTVKKSDLTGAVAVVDTKEMKKSAAGTLVSQMQGLATGINVRSSGRAGEDASIEIRGVGSLSNNSPLWVIDGMITDPGVDFNPADAESIQILKDASAAAIYGSRAANGVIIITTKRAKKGETRVDFDMSLTLQTYQCGFDMLNADEWGQVYWSAYKYANNGATPSSEIYGNGATPQLQDYIGLNGAKVHAVDTDWRDVVYRTALMQNYSATLSKGSDNGAFSLALNYLDHDGLVENTNFQRINTRISSNYHYLDNRLRIGENVAINRWTQTLSPAGVDENAIKQHPAKTVYDENGNYNDAINDVLGDAPNMARLLENEKQNKHDYWRVFGNAFLEIEPIKNLVLKTNFVMNYYDETNKTF